MPMTTVSVVIMMAMNTACMVIIRIGACTSKYTSELASCARYLEGPEHKESMDDLMLCVSATNRRRVVSYCLLIPNLSPQQNRAK